MDVQFGIKCYHQSISHEMQTGSGEESIIYFTLGQYNLLDFLQVGMY